MNAQELEERATILRNQGKGYESIPVYQQAKDLYVQTGSLARAAGCQHMIGVSYKIENDIEKAMPAYEEAIEEYRKAGDALGPGRVHRDIGIMYEYHDQLDKAESYLLRSREELESVSDESQAKNAELGITLAKLGLIDIRFSRLDSAEKYLMEGLQFVRTAGHPFYEMTALLHLGMLYFVTKHYGRSLANLEAALGLVYEYEMQNEQTRRLAQIWGLMAHAYSHHDNPQTARHFAKKSLEVIAGLSKTAQIPLRKDIDADSLEALLN